MKKVKRIAALAGIVLLLGLYIATFIFALLDSPQAVNYFKASLFSTIFVPILLYGMMLIYKVLKNDRALDSEENKEDAR